jgi:hypothetical protein
MKYYKYVKECDNGNIIKTKEEYCDNNILKSININIYNYTKDKIISHSKYYYDDGIQLHCEIIMNYKDDYTHTKSYYKNGKIKGESKTVDNTFVLHTKYNENDEIIKEWRTELSMGE